MVDPIATPNLLTLDDGATIAYHRTPGKAPGVMFLTGFKSDMTGGKAMAVEALCRRLGHACLRFDYFGHGQSSGAFADGTIGRWAADAVAVIDRLTEGPLVLVGSSMGGWIMLLAALARPKRVVGLVGFAAAPDFTEDLIPAALSEAQKAELADTGEVAIPNCYDEEPYLIRQRLLDEGRDNLVLRGPIALDVPVRLIHGMRDADVPWRTGLKIVEHITGDDIEITYVKAGQHRLSEDRDLRRLERTLEALLEDLT